MRYIDELHSTTNNFVYNRVRIPYDSVCGWCAVGSGCNLKRKWNLYQVVTIPTAKNKYYPFKNKDIVAYRQTSKHPNWKLVSKCRKQWMGKPIKKKPYKYLSKSMREYQDDYEIIW